jgi:HlyD family secretion protein
MDHQEYVNLLRLPFEASRKNSTRVKADSWRIDERRGTTCPIGDPGPARLRTIGVMRLPAKPWLIVVPVLLVMAAFMAWRTLRGPELPGYLPEKQPLVQTVVATGRVISTSRVQVGSEITATVVERRRKEGDRVKPGDVLVVLRADDLGARVREAEAALQELLASTRPEAQAALRQAEAQLAQAMRERQRRATLLERALVARETVEQAEETETIAREAVAQARSRAAAAAQGGTLEQQARERLAAARAAFAKTELRATVAGTVLTRNVEPGDLVQPGRVLMEIARDGVTEIEVPVDEKNLAVLALGQKARCVTDAFPDKPFAATLSYIAPSVDTQRGSIDIRLRAEPPPDFLRQDMTVSVNVETGRRDSALAVPNDALRDAQGDRAQVLVLRDGRVRAAAVRIGLRGQSSSEVTEGLQAGDQVLANAASTTVAEGARARFKAQAMPASGDADAQKHELPVNFN